ncbi:MULTISPECIES: sulfotransferase domain-containing protein [Arthrospira]|uniref:sulfotransferase domain-containing protein n=1 Tax=Limnospira TaxID=2596745 RepID=UPI000291ECAA|nr:MULTISPECIES: sulfotransferase domain-containing protein [Arthrospira]AMW26848.1 sulfotransferase [Arthrospira platensis YZ]KDR57337.1 sulfotransferase [Arthrospira platensis str. Paraca]MBD2669333.1 sulfotransferase domain-containing protein [Arthrospira platensis FACHB-439]MBD2709769.1 sulfotransferase domain-containing protein [Arthrospira platensis FACHB-835]MDT9310029.1 sulfotransferase domain-containing protein [Limnospira sp. Paracas R14]QQW29601.1 sulfotransferase domain-containing
MFSSAYKYKVNQWYFRPTDVFLASYPRSGNTWMRLLLSDVIQQLGGEKTQPGGNVIPDVYKVDIEDWYRNPRIKIPFRIIKTHEPLDLISDYRIIYLFRHPADCLCSYYHYQLRSPRFRENNSGIDGFCQNLINQWCGHINGYLEAAKTGSDRLFLVSYESLNINPVESLKNVCNFLDLDITEAQAQIAVNNQQFRQVQTLSQRGDSQTLGFAENGGYQNFFRRGQINSSTQELSENTRTIISHKSQDIYNQIRELESQQLTNINSN